MGRLNLFEIHDHSLFPPSLRDFVTDALQALWKMSNVYEPVLPRLEQALIITQSSKVIDLCSGGGGPWLKLLDCSTITVCLTDKYPNLEAFEEACSQTNSRITFDPRSVNALAVPRDLEGFRTMFSSFHHFNSDDAREVLQDAMLRDEGIAIFEMAARNASTVMVIFSIPFVILFLTPRIRPFRFSRLFWTYVFPVIPFVLWFDGLMSCLRSYSVKELEELVTGLTKPHYRWEIGRQNNKLLSLTYLVGCPPE